MQKLTKIISSIALGTGLLAVSANIGAVPLEITITNNTDLALNSSIAGMPGNGIAPNITKNVPYGIITIGCNYAGTLGDCPITFSDKATGETVAMVRINANTGSLTGAPTFYGSYGDTYMVTGWEDSPISHITITKKG